MLRSAHANRWAAAGSWCCLIAVLALCWFGFAGQGQTSASAAAKKKSGTSASSPKKAATTSAVAPKAAPAAAKAAGGLVHKSAAYWSGYRSNVIQQVFDGDFRGAEMDRNTQFHILFSGYVEQYSDNCSDYLRGHYDHRVIDHSVNGVVSTSAINIDYRYLPKYDEYTQNTGLDTLRVLTGAASFGDVIAPSLDINRFFSIEKCNSAAVRQLSENLLRAANGQPSLQASGGSIAGAAAESQVDAVPSQAGAGPAVASRLGPFGDGCNAFMYDPKTSRYAPRDPDAYCKCLSDGYRDVMTAAEEADYGKNFEAKFWRGIAQPRSDDPAWPRLHPVAVSCMQ